MPAVLAIADYDLPTRSASGFLLRWIAPRMGPVTLFSIFDRKLPFRLFAPQADVIVGMGHGDPDVFTGQSEAIILEVGEYDPKEVNGKVIKLLACQCGVELCQDMVSNGAICSMGYKDDYVWIVDADLASTPWSDKMAAACLMPVVNGLNSLLDGEEAQEAMATELISYSINAEAEEDELIRSCIEFNRKNAVLFGNGGARIKARPDISLPFPPPPLLIPLRA